MSALSLLITNCFTMDSKKQINMQYFFGFCDKRKKQKGVTKMKELLKQKLREKSIIENRILKAHKANNYYTVNELLNDLYYIEEEIRSYKNAK